MAGLTPVVSDQIAPINYGSHLGEFAAIEGNGVSFVPNYGANSLTLTLAVGAAASFVSLPGDYNGNGAVDAADYTVYRNMLGQSVPALSSADGNGNGIVEDKDYDIWKTNLAERCRY